MYDCSPLGLSGGVPCPGDVAGFARVVSASLPPGWAWDAADDDDTLMAARVRTIAYMLQQLHEWSCEIRKEFRCHTADATMESWLADYGLPDACGLNDLCAKIIASGGQSCSSYVELGAMLGVDVCCRDLAPEIQPGCWDLGRDQMPPDMKPRFGGSELGFASLGVCEVASHGSNLGHEQIGGEDCSIVGYTDPIEDVVSSPLSPCVTVADCVRFEHVYPPLIVGCARPMDISHYVGTAYHWIVGLEADQPLLGSNARCEPPPGIDQFDVGVDALGTYVPGVDVPEAFAVAGCWEIGISELCTPPTEPMFCFIQRFRPAHTVPIRRYCEET